MYWSKHRASTGAMLITVTTTITTIVLLVMKYLILCVPMRIVNDFATQSIHCTCTARRSFVKTLGGAAS